MCLPRHHEQTRACRSITDPEQQAVTVGAHRRGKRALVVAALTAAALTTGTAPALAQPQQPTTPVAAAQQSGPERVHQALASSAIEEAISAAEAQEGKPYGWGGTGPDSFDCSGLVQHAFGEAGVKLPRIAHDQVGSGTRVSYANAERGDLLYWTDSGGYAYHVAIYLGGDRMVDAPSSGGKVGERAVMRHNLAGGVRL